MSQKYPSPDAAVKFAVLMDVCQSTVPVLPNPDCDAPYAKATVFPHPPKVNVDPDSVVTVFTLIVLVIIIEIYILLLPHLIHQHHPLIHHKHQLLH